jgi:hypothetical protein
MPKGFARVALAGCRLAGPALAAGLALVVGPVCRLDCAALVICLVRPSETQQLHRQHNFWTAFTWTRCTLHSKFVAGMKTSILAAAGFASSALAGVHRMKLEKIPLKQQLVSKSSLLLTANLRINGCNRKLPTLMTTFELWARSTRRSSWARPRTSSGTPPLMLTTAATMFLSRTS